MKNKKLEAILDTIKLRDEKGKIYPISDELMLQYILNFLTQKPLEAIIVDRYDLATYHHRKENIITKDIYNYYIDTIFRFYLNSPRRLRLYDSLSSNKKHDIEYRLNEEHQRSYYQRSTKISYTIVLFKDYFLGDNYFSDLEQVITDKGILNSLIYHAFEVEYGKDIAYLEFVPSEFDAKIKEQRKQLYYFKEFNDAIQELVEKGEIVNIEPEG